MWREWRAYLSRREGKLFLVLSLAALGVSYALFLTVLLPWLTRQGEEYRLPNLAGRPYPQVAQALAEAGFSPVLLDSQYVPETTPLTILLQDPPPNTRIKKGRKIYLTVASATPPQIPFPQVKELPYEQAHRLLRESYGFRIGDVIYVSGSVPDIVVGVRYAGKPIEAGQPIPRYATVDLVVSRGLSKEKVPFVSVVGLPIEEAVARINAAGLTVGHIRYKVHAGVPPGYVYRQYPDRVPGDSLPAGTAIDLFVNGQSPSTPAE
ncbi:MAG: PASTA domain-containing protein [Bacteroidetes bacterium]|nr:MAG: PASTA domain-containing protein [Bacteroidota bacterium]